MNKIV